MTRWKGGAERLEGQCRRPRDRWIQRRVAGAAVAAPPGRPPVPSRSLQRRADARPAALRAANLSLLLPAAAAGSFRAKESSKQSWLLLLSLPRRPPPPPPPLLVRLRPALSSTMPLSRCLFVFCELARPLAALQRARCRCCVVSHGLGRAGETASGASWGPAAAGSQQTQPPAAGARSHS